MKEVVHRSRTGVFLCVFLLGAGWTDLRLRKVSNLWLLAGALCGIVVRGRAFLPDAMLVLVPSYLLFRMRMMGAGDGKLAALIAGYLGIGDGLNAIAAGLAVGAVWSMYQLVRNQIYYKNLTDLTAWFWRILHLGKTTEYWNYAAREETVKIPLAVCLTVGTCVYLCASFAVR